METTIGGRRRRMSRTPRPRPVEPATRPPTELRDSLGDAVGGGLRSDQTADYGLTDEIAARIGIALLPGVGDRTTRVLIDRFGSVRAALSTPPRHLPRRVSRATRRAPRGEDIDRRLESVLGVVRESGLYTTGYGLPGFPEELNHLHDPPPLLFLRGDRGLLNLPTVAVVGSRRATEYGREVSKSLGEGLGVAGVAVSSGLALGIDGAAHRGALGVGGATIAVLGAGPDVVHPPSHRRLFEGILESGLIISEFLPGERPLPHHFPKRNRLIAALSRAVVVVEAARRSGALITVDHALDLGRDVFAVPGPVGRPQSEGVHALLRDGAGLVTSAADVLAATGLGCPDEGLRTSSGARSSEPSAPAGLDLRQKVIWDALDSDPSHVDTLAGRTGLDVAAVTAVLSVMELRGWAMQSPGLRYSRRVWLGGVRAADVGEP